MELTESDRQHLRAAEGWLELGNVREAYAELEAIDPRKLRNADVLRVVCQLLEAAGQWNALLKFSLILFITKPNEMEGYVYGAIADHHLGRTAAAREALLRVLDRFPKSPPIPYCLARFACKLGNLEEARQWWKKAKALSRDPQFEQIAREDPELKPLWESAN